MCRAQLRELISFKCTDANIANVCLLQKAIYKAKPTIYVAYMCVVKNYICTYITSIFHMDFFLFLYSNECGVSVLSICTYLLKMQCKCDLNIPLDRFIHGGYTLWVFYMSRNEKKEVLKNKTTEPFVIYRYLAN